MAISSERDTVCVLGLGLIGGSLLRALAVSGWTVFGYNRSAETVEQARAEFDISTDLISTLHRAAQHEALIVLAVPVPALGSILPHIAAHARACALTDVCSTKASVRDAVAQYGLSDNFIGGHPMAGTAQSAWQATDSKLFIDSPWVISTDDDANPEVWRRVAVMAHSVGARVIAAATEEHDTAVAAISHVPHILSDSLALLGADSGELALRLAAGSFKDGTRVAATAPALQQAIIEPNAEAVLFALDALLSTLTAARAELAAESSVSTITAAGFTARTKFDALEIKGEFPKAVPGSADWARKYRKASIAGKQWLP